MKRRRNISQADIAREAGVSQPVVSAALSNSATIAVSESTRKRILQAAKDLGYRTSDTKIRPRGRNGGLFPILWLDAAPDYNRTEENSHLAEAAYAAREQQILNQVIKKLGEQDYTLIVKHVTNERECMEWLKKNRVAGIFWHMGGRLQSLLSLAMSRTPVVSLGRSFNKQIDRVVVDQESVVELAIEHLIDYGHEKIAYFGQISYDELLEERRKHYERLIRAKQLRVYDEFLAIPDHKEQDSAFKAAEILNVWERIRPKNRPSAIILNDVHALNLFNEAYNRGISVPDQLSVVGIDELPYGNISRPRLTSVRNPISDEIETVVDLLLERIRNPARSPRLVMFSPTLVIRDSVKRIDTKERSKS